jgi:TPP-dependent pyruvate/acetoin dehydrogenase alpha subunit
MQLSRDDLLRAYREMRTIRVFEDRANVEFATGEMPGFIHLYAGEEGSAVGVCMNLDDDDTIASTHRGHGHCIAKGCDVKGMMRELYGSAEGICKGKGGSMHIADLDRGMLGANGIVGGGPPLICGAALAAKTLGNGAVAVGFVGDGGSNQGQFLESLNFSSVFKLPAIYVVEDNGYAEVTASVWACAGDQVKRAEGFGIPGRRVDGFDFFDMHDAAHEAVSRARAGQGPSVIDVKFERFNPHEEGIKDTHRLPEHVAWLKENKDPIDLFRTRVTESGELDSAQLDAIDGEVGALIEEAVAEAKAAPPVSVDQLLTDVYVSY